jgi:hypothetical protein
VAVLWGGRLGDTQIGSERDRLEQMALNGAADERRRRRAEMRTRLMHGSASWRGFTDARSFGAAMQQFGKALDELGQGR